MARQINRNFGYLNPPPAPPPQQCALHGGMTVQDQMNYINAYMDVRARQIYDKLRAIISKIGGFDMSEIDQIEFDDLEVNTLAIKKRDAATIDGKLISVEGHTHQADDIPNLSDTIGGIVDVKVGDAIDDNIGDKIQEKVDDKLPEIKNEIKNSVQGTIQSDVNTAIDQKMPEIKSTMDEKIAKALAGQQPSTPSDGLEFEDLTETT